MTPQEKLKEKLRLMTKSIGIIQVVKSIGLEDYFEKVDGLDFLSETELIDSIKQCLEITAGLQYNEIGIEPIFIRESDDEIHLAEYFTKNRVVVQVWGGYNYQTDEGEYGIQYERLSKDGLMLILYGLLDYMEYEMIL